MKNTLKSCFSTIFSLLLLLFFLSFQSCNQEAASSDTKATKEQKEVQADEKKDKPKISTSLKGKLDAIMRYCEYFNEMKYREISELFAPKVDQFITVKDLTNEAVGKMAFDFLIKKNYVDYTAHVDEAKEEGDAIRLPIEIRWEGYHAKVLTEFKFNQDYKISSLKELKILEKRKIIPKVKTRKGEILNTYNNCNFKKEGMNCTHYQMEYELIEDAPNAEVKDMVNKLVLNFEGANSGDEAAFRAYHQKQAEKFAEDARDFAAQGMALHQQYSNHFEELGEVLTLVETYSEYMGGAHGMGFSTTRHFDLNSGKEIRFGDIFKEDAEPELREIIQKQMEELGYDFPDQQPLPANFHFGMKRLIFYYNQYELGMYLPAPGFHLKYNEVKHLMKPDSPVYSIINQ
jgi:hypothetical protein